MAAAACRASILIAFLSAFCCAQVAPPPDAPPTFSTTVATFGTTVVIPGGLTGEIYELPIGTPSLPNFKKMEPVGKIYTRRLWVPAREFSEGFPVITNRFEYF